MRQVSNPFRVNNITKTDKPTRFYSDRQEKEVAKITGGKQVANSGAGDFAPGDVKLEQWLLECKTRTKNSDSINIKRDWFEKQLNECIQAGKPYSALVFNFGPDTPYNKNYYIIDEYLFLELLEYLKTKNE